MKSTLCYIEQDGRYLMLLRNKKKIDMNKDKWIGVGGKFEEGENASECILREVLEETGLHLLDYRLRGIVYFSDESGYTEDMYLYTASSFEGELTDCPEGQLAWIPKEDVPNLNLWEGDREFLKLLAEDAPFFHLYLQYDHDKLIGKEII